MHKRHDLTLNLDNLEPQYVDKREDTQSKGPKTPKVVKQSSNINLDAATIHIIGDIINSIGVIFAATMIYVWPSLWYLDPFCTYFFSILVMVTTYPVTVKCLNILLEMTPDNIS